MSKQKQVIWQTRPGQESNFEREYINDVLLSQLNATYINDQARYLIDCSGSIVIFATHDTSIPLEFLTYLGKSRDYVLLQLWLERLVHDTSYYKNARYVFRTYFDPRINDENVFFLPVGFQSGFLNTDTATSTLDEKIYQWSFAGQLKSHRRKMINALSEVKPNFIYLTNQWADPNALNIKAMRDVYSKTIFAPCPFGNRNPDSYRIMEALEYGCIPIVVTFLGNDYFKYVFGDHPFIVASSWTDAAFQMKRLISSPEKLRIKQNETIQWYKEFKYKLAYDMASLILENAPRSQLMSIQFFHQSVGQSWITRRLYDLYYGHGLHRRLFRWLIQSL